MFQTDFHVFLQSFKSEYLTTFMRFITSLGYLEFFMVFLTIILFVIDFKKGFLLLMVLFWTAGITLFLKDYFHLPRPFHVDSRVQFLDGKLRNDTAFDFSEMGAKAFWELLPVEVLDEVRKTKAIAFGFPSGHTSIAVALWGALILLFRRKWVAILSISMMLLIPFSRLYLGVHFIADVLGGYAIGATVLFLFYLAILREKQLQPYLQKPRLPIALNWRTIFLLISPFVFLFPLTLSVDMMRLPGSMFGYGLSFCLLAYKGFPEKGGSWGQKIGRMLIAIVLYLAINFVFSQGMTYMGWDDNLLLSFLRYSIEGFIFLWVAVELNIKLGWFERMKKREMRGV